MSDETPLELHGVLLDILTVENGTLSRVPIHHGITVVVTAEVELEPSTFFGRYDFHTASEVGRRPSGISGSRDCLEVLLEQVLDSCRCNY